MLKSNLGAFTAGVFYIFAPYHLVDLHFKVVIGEILFFTLLPYTLFFVYKLIHEKTSLYTYIVGFLFAFLIMSHIILAVFTSALFFFYALLLRSRKKRKVSFMRIFLSFFIGFGISLYMWVGPIILSKYSFIQKIDLGFAHFPTFLELIYSPWRIGFLFQGPQGETSHLIGYGHLFILIFTFYLLFKRKGIEQFTADQTLWLVFSFIIIFLISPFSKPLWGISFLKVVGSHRLLVLLVFSISILAGYISFYFKKKWILYLLIDVTIFSTILNWGQRRMIPSITDQTLIQNLPLSTSRGEAHFYANTKWVDTKNPWFSKVPKNHLEIINGQGEVKEIQRTSTKHLYLVSAETPLFMKENTLYFPGWKVLNNGVERNVEYQNQTYQGVITFSISQGLHKLEIKYEDIVEYKILKIISMVSFITILLSTIYIAIKKVYQCKET